MISIDFNLELGLFIVLSTILLDQIVKAIVSKVLGADKVILANR